MRDPDSSSDIPEGTAAHEGPRQEQEKKEEGRSRENKGRKLGAATRNYHTPTQSSALGVVSTKGLAETEHKVVKEGKSGLEVEGEVLV